MQKTGAFKPTGVCCACGADIRGRGPQARRCAACVVRKRNAEQAGKRPSKRGYMRAWKLKKNYGLTPEQDAALGDTCAVCLRGKLSGGNRHVDHDHVSGRVRGVLCRRCNTGIGMLGDSLIGVLRAAEYLAK